MYTHTKMSMSQKGVWIVLRSPWERRLSRGRLSGCARIHRLHPKLQRFIIVPSKANLVYRHLKYTLNIPDLDNKMLAIFSSMKFHIFRISPFSRSSYDVLYGRGTPEAPLLPWWRLRAGPSTSKQQSTVAHPSAMSRWRKGGAGGWP